MNNSKPTTPIPEPTPLRNGTQQGESTTNIRVVISDVKPPLTARVFRGVMHGLCVVLLLLVCSLGVPRLFGIQEFNVMTGSMTPNYPVGTLVFVQPCEAATLQVGDVVTCVMNENLDVITHRVVANDTAAGTITTRGDANNSDDAPTLYANVVGKVVFSAAGVGNVVDFFTGSTQGRIAGVVLLVGLVVLTLLSETLCNNLSSQTARVQYED